MSISQPASQPDSIDLAYDMWAGQFEFVGPANAETSASDNNETATQNNANATNSPTTTTTTTTATSSLFEFGQKNASQKSSSLESLEDLNLNFNNNSNNNDNNNFFNDNNYLNKQQQQQPILLDQEPFLSLNPCDFENIVPSEPSSLLYIDNKLIEEANAELVQNIESLANKLINSKSDNNKQNNIKCNPNNVVGEQLNHHNSNGYKLENLKNIKNKLICGEFDEKSAHATSAVDDMYNNNKNNNNNNNNNNISNGHQNNNSLNGGVKINNALSMEICENLNEQLELLQRQVTDLADTQSIAEDRTTRTKTEYAVLQARYHMLEDQFREAELRAEERFSEEQKRSRELASRLERETALKEENFQMKIKTLETEVNVLRDETQRLRLLCDKQANDLHRNEEKLELAQDQIGTLEQDISDYRRHERQYEQEKKAAEELMLELSSELERVRSQTGPALPTTPQEAIRLEELHLEMEEMRSENKNLTEQLNQLKEAQAEMLARSVEEGRHLLNGAQNSLADELGEMSQTQDSVDSATLASLSQLQQSCQEMQEENARLKRYIDSILVNIVENYPQLLEVKAVNQMP